jgi:hypothetical protein
MPGTRRDDVVLFRFHRQYKNLVCGEVVVDGTWNGWCVLCVVLFIPISFVSQKIVGWYIRLFLTDLAGPYPGILTGFLSGVFLPSGLYFQKSVKMFRIPFLMIIL